MQFGLIGKTLEHSFSSQIHPLIFDCEYENIELSENELDSFFKKRDFKGINVTIPYKQAVIPFIDVLDETAEKIGAVNTVLNRNGKLYGYNTDFYGLASLIEKNNVSIKGKNCLILGSGGTSNTAKAVCEYMGAKSVTKLSRTKSENCDTYDNLKNYFYNTDIIINTTPCGMYPDIYKTAASLDGFSNLEAVFDVVYNPINTKLIIDAKKKGIIAEGGTYMLVFQAVFAARLFSGKDIPVSKGEEIFNLVCKQKQNIVLIGMPSSGKTTVGKILSEKLSKKFIDTDSEIEKKTNRTPKEIIEENGEEYFRNTESEIIKEISKNQNSVIATGGGAVLRETNIDLLKENGILFFLNRDFDDLTVTDSRPLSSTKEKLKLIFEERLPIYKKYADFFVDVDSSSEKTAERVMAAIDI